MRLAAVSLLAVMTCASQAEPTPAPADVKSPAGAAPKADAKADEKKADAKQDDAKKVAPPELPASGEGSLTCCELAAGPAGSPSVSVDTMVSMIKAVKFLCLEISEPAVAQRALEACMRKLDSATVKACVGVSDPELGSCATQSYARSVDGRTLLGLASDLQLDDYGWSIAELRDDEPHTLFPHGAPYVHPYCEEPEHREPDSAAQLAELPAHVEKAPESVRSWICSGPPR